MLEGESEKMKKIQLNKEIKNWIESTRVNLPNPRPRLWA